MRAFAVYQMFNTQLRAYACFKAHGVRLTTGQESNVYASYKDFFSVKQARLPSLWPHQQLSV